MRFFEKMARQSKPYLLGDQKGKLFVQKSSVIYFTNLISGRFSVLMCYFERAPQTLFGGEPYRRELPVQEVFCISCLNLNA